MPIRSGGRYEIRDGEPVLVSRTDHPPAPTPSAQPAAVELTGPATDEEDADDADA